ncbi:Tsr2p TDEL_0D01040 [Torulaspora delbrueckii]|uniref:Pre-rRNA-processing protein TSR2 n=1 Tax=Torulaspora delbrueckii TaxID=4950 RepID=G8ZSU4_TORDE|nr:hypothetical protein TDEL_0D01040 [Torulaspora delbrueckii]CCE91688.1 hypothetical protein TDEL_0D01040 [Torulaspora delbrueckii]
MSSTAYDLAVVEAPTEAKNLQFEDEKQQARFELGVSMMVYKWEALEVAVANSWGGPSSAEKRDWITAIVVDLFKSEKIVDAATIEETLLYAMIDEFDTNVEDESTVPIAVGIIDIYKQCQVQDYSTVEQLYTKWVEKQNSGESAKVITIEEDPLNPDASSCDEGDEEDEDEGEGEEDIEMNDQPSSGPVVDEDGFELVQKKGRR